MPVQDSYNVKQAEGREFHALEADMYQVEISDVEVERDKENPYKPGQLEDQFIFHLKVVSEEERAAYLRVYCTAKWFDGGKTGKSSKYYQIFTAVHEYYSKGEKQNAVDSLSGNAVNALIGKQLRVTVTKDAKSDGSGYRNKVSTFMPIKKELPAIQEGEEYVAPGEDVNIGQ